MYNRNYPIYRPDIERWVQSVDPSSSPEVPNQNGDSGEARVKRPRIHPRDDRQFEYSDLKMSPCMPQSSPVSHPGNASPDPANGRKRDHNNGVESGHRTPKPFPPQYPMPAKPGNPLFLRDLIYLEKPIVFVGGTSLVDLPVDAKVLHCELHYVIDLKHRIFPIELRRKIEEIVGSPLPPERFRAPDPAGYLRVASTFLTLFGITRAAALSQKLNRHEEGWNNMVHSPLLRLAFPAAVGDRGGGAANGSGEVSVRFEPTMSATISQQWIPRFNWDAASHEKKRNFQLADVAYLGGFCPSYINGTSGGDRGSHHALLSKTPVDTPYWGVKIDYVLALDVLDGPLKPIIAGLLRAEFIWSPDRGASGGLPGLNQTDYQPLRDSPIAVAIGTQIDTAPRDPIAQLGIWTVAWHKRMKALYRARAFQVLDNEFRARLAGQQAPDQPSNEAPPSPRLVSLPLIVAMAHKWAIYYACDRGDRIDLYGPFYIGSTENIVEAYVLLSSLGAIEKWLHTTFYTAMKSWFQCDG